VLHILLPVIEARLRPLSGCARDRLGGGDVDKAASVGVMRPGRIEENA
jgi:hypothetical protein